MWMSKVFNVAALLLFCGRGHQTLKKSVLSKEMASLTSYFCLSSDFIKQNQYFMT